MKTTSKPATATHPMKVADIVIGTEADWGSYNKIGESGALEGFDIELTQMVCELAGVTCAIVTVPWHSVWPSFFTEFPPWQQAPSGKGNVKTYPGVGYNNKWFHCSVGTRNILARQQSTAFTDPYTDPAADTAGFVVPDAVDDFPANAGGKKVGLLTAQAPTTYFKSQVGASPLMFDATVEIHEEDEAADVWALLTAGTVDAVYQGASEANDWIASNSNYKFVHATAGWSDGVAYGCRPEFGDKLQALNAGLRAFKQTSEYMTLAANWGMPGDCQTTCGAVKEVYKSLTCCGAPDTVVGKQLF